LTASKILWIDFGYFMFRAIYGWKKNPAIPPTYMCLVSIISNLKKVGLNPEDTVIIAVDSPKGSWRKEVDSDYKANRRAQREKDDIDWDSIFESFNLLIEQIEACTPFHAIVVDKMEADDIIAYGCKKYQDTTSIILSADSDFEQLCAYPKVRIFSPLSKKYKEVKNPYKVVLQKIRKEASDNLISPILSKADYERRNKIVNLIKLPEEIEATISPYFDFLPEKPWDIESLPFETLHSRLLNIYAQDRVVGNKPTRKKKKPSPKQITL